MGEKEWWAAASKAAEYRHKVRENMCGCCGKEGDLMLRDRQASWNGLLPNALPYAAGKEGHALRRAGGESSRWIEWD